MKDHTEDQNFATVLADHVRVSRQSGVGADDSLGELTARQLDLEVTVAGARIVLSNGSPDLPPTGARVTVRLKLDGTSLELGVARDSLRALLHSRVPNADLDLLEGPSGPLVAEHLAAKAIEQLERALKRRIVVFEIEDGDGEPTDQSRPVLHAAFGDETIPDCAVTLGGGGEVLEPILKLLIDNAPEISDGGPGDAMLDVSLRSPVFALNPSTAAALRPGDCLLLDERFADLSSCRVWIDGMFSAALELESGAEHESDGEAASALMLLEIPVPMTDIHWCPGPDDRDAAQLVIGSRQFSRAQVETFGPGEPVKIAVHSLTPVELRITGRAHCTGTLRRICGQFAFVLDDDRSNYG